MAAVMWLQQMAAGRRRAGGGSGSNTSWVRPAQDGPLTLPLPPRAVSPPAVLPAEWYPQAVRDVQTWYFDTYKDPLVGAAPRCGWVLLGAVGACR